MSQLDRTVASHVLRELARQQLRGRAANLDALASSIGVRREDVRSVVSRLNAEGHVDAHKMRLTMSGLALAVSMRQCKLPSARPSAPPSYTQVA